MLYTGKGITAAVLDTGIRPHVDFDRRITGFVDFVHGMLLPYDDNSHGTHVSGLLAGSGAASGGRYRGVAPLCQIVALKILDERGLGDSSSLIAAIEWVRSHAVEYGIRIINISVGGLEESAEKQERILQCVERAWEDGLVVIAAAGNMGPGRGTITAPGSSCRIITVGSSDMLMGRRGTSGRGPVNHCPFKPDVVAPGSGLISCYGANGYMEKSGTSMSTPLVSGAVALLLEKEPALTNEEIKQRICRTSDSLNLEPNIQGCGRLNIKRLLSE